MIGFYVEKGYLRGTATRPLMIFASSVTALLERIGRDHLTAPTVSVMMAAKMLGVSHDSTLRYLREGRIAGYQIIPGGWWHVDRASVEALRRGARDSADALAIL